VPQTGGLDPMDDKLREARLVIGGTGFPVWWAGLDPISVAMENWWREGAAPPQ
jgi:hypothetical protein